MNASRTSPECVKFTLLCENVIQLRTHGRSKGTGCAGENIKKTGVNEIETSSTRVQKLRRERCEGGRALFC